MLGFCIASQAQFNKCTNGSTVRKNNTISVGRADVSKLKDMTLQDYKHKIDAVSDIDCFPDMGLHVVVDSLQLDKLHALLASDSLKATSIDLKDENGDTPLMRALKVNQPKMAQELITYACNKTKIENLMIANSAKKYPLTLAIEKKSQEVANQLIEKLTQQQLQTIITSSTIHPLSLAIKHNLSTVANNMIDKLDSSDFITASNEEKQVDGTPLHVAVTFGNKNLLSKMIVSLTDEQVMTKGCKRDASPLHLAVAKQNDTAELLIHKLDVRYFKEVDSKKRTPLHIAAAYNAQSLFQLMWNKVVKQYSDHDSELESYLIAEDNDKRTLFARAYLPQTKTGRRLNMLTTFGNTKQNDMFSAILMLTKDKINDHIKNKIIDEIDKEFPRKNPTKPGEGFNRTTQRNHSLKQIIRGNNLTVPDHAFAKEIPLPSA